MDGAARLFFVGPPHQPKVRDVPQELGGGAQRHRRRLGDAAEARGGGEKLRRALELLPGDSDALSLGALLSSQGRKDDLEAYRASPRSTPTTTSSATTSACSSANAASMSRRSRCTGRARDRRTSGWRANLGVALASTGQLGASEEPFANACKFQPENANNWINLAKLHHALGRSEQAAEAMARAKQLKGVS